MNRDEEDADENRIDGDRIGGNRNASKLVSRIVGRHVIPHCARNREIRI